jgi:hypothetical protein
MINTRLIGAREELVSPDEGAAGVAGEHASPPTTNAYEITVAILIDRPPWRGL